jgi:hypothetical protein
MKLLHNVPTLYDCCVIRALTLTNIPKTFKEKTL